MGKNIKLTEERENVVEDLEKIEVKSGGFSLRFKFSKKSAFIIIVVLLIALVPSAYFYYQYQNANNLLKNPKAQTSVQTKSVVEAVGRLIELPIGEEPKLATVTDVTQLSGQAFFAKAKNGDRVLIYAQAGKAILYRESINKIIEVSPVNTATAPTQVTTSGQEVKPQAATAIVLNGTSTSGLAKLAQAKIQTDLTNITILSVGDAANGGYEKTVVIDVSGAKSEAAAQVAKVLGASLQKDVPGGENKPNSDILIILGNDYSK